MTGNVPLVFFAVACTLVTACMDRSTNDDQNNTNGPPAAFSYVPISVEYDEQQDRIRVEAVVAVEPIMKDCEVAPYARVVHAYSPDVRGGRFLVPMLEFTPIGKNDYQAYMNEIGVDDSSTLPDMHIELPDGSDVNVYGGKFTHEVYGYEETLFFCGLTTIVRGVDSSDYGMGELICGACGSPFCGDMSCDPGEDETSCAKDCETQTHL